MAITTLYFSTAAAGAADGTSWANRATLFNGSNNWSSVLTGFDFSSNSLLALIGPGNYTCAQELNTTAITTDPTIANPLFLHGCDSSGNMLTAPDPDWVSAQPAFSDSTLPVIATASNIRTINCDNVFISFLKLTASARNGEIIAACRGINWCHVINSTSNASAICISFTSPFVSNSFLQCSGSTYNYVITRSLPSAGALGKTYNCRIAGGGSSGTCMGVQFSGNSYPTLSNCTIYGHYGHGIGYAGSSTAALVNLDHCTIVDCGGSGLEMRMDAAQTSAYTVNNCYIANCLIGINGNSGAGRCFVANSRLRNNTTGDIYQIGNYPTTFDNYTTDGDDTEFVNYANGDYRIANAASAVWGKGYGAGDEPPASTGGGIWMPRARQIGV